MERFFFVPEQNYSAGDIIKIEGDEHIHLSKVLRANVGDRIICLPNNGTYLKCVILGFTKQYTEVKVDYVDTQTRDSFKKVTMFIASLKADKFEFALTKLTELGITDVVPFESKFITAKFVCKPERHTKICMDACKQCRRSKMINVHPYLKFDEVISLLPSYSKTIVAYENEQNFNLKGILSPQDNNIALVVGSEGGFSNDEIMALKNAGAQIVTLGKRILRAETAIVTLASLAMYDLGELN